MPNFLIGREYREFLIAYGIKLLYINGFFHLENQSLNLISGFAQKSVNYGVA